MHSATKDSAPLSPELADGSGNSNSNAGHALSESRAAVVVGLIAAGLRACWVLLAARAPVGLSDPYVYLSAAASLSEGNGYTSLLGRSTAYYPPGYPMFVALVQRVSELIGQGPRLILILGLAQAVLGGVGAAALVIAGNRLRPGAWLGVLAGLLFAFWPNLIIHSGLVLSESLYLSAFCVLLAALCVWTCKPGVTTRSNSVLVISAVLGATALCALVRPQSVAVLLPAVGLGWLLGGLGWRFALRGLALLVLGMLIAILPWTLRNALVMNAFVPMSTNTGDNFCIGFHDGATGGFSIAAACATRGNYTDGPEIEVARDGELRARTLRWIADNPGEIPALSFQKLQITLSHDADAVFAFESYGADAHLSNSERSLLNWVCNGYYWAVSLLALVGVALVLRDWRAAIRSTANKTTANMLTANKRIASYGLVLVFVCMFGALLPVLFFGHERFKIPILPCVALLAALAIHSFFHRNPQGSTQGTQQDVASESAEQEARQ
ncbi:MAG: hypothetical protein F2744_09155 [Actinobacteria bacterium]|uniref:Unannotated protein n=1 Tax=freshwater metagenome TaxID=449393 RepID=A0A6J6ZID1_9ZZZZ|nr:hypothetical protein [Actinomycetota bacterium]